MGAGAADVQRIDLTAYELASSLSFYLLNSIPDAELWQAAEDGSLLVGDNLDRQVTRMLALPKVQQNLTRVHMKWVGLGEGINVDLASKFPDFSPELKSQPGTRDPAVLPQPADQAGHAGRRSDLAPGLRRSAPGQPLRRDLPGRQRFRRGDLPGQSARRHRHPGRDPGPPLAQSSGGLARQVRARRTAVRTDWLARPTCPGWRRKAPPATLCPNANKVRGARPTPPATPVTS